MIFGGIPMMLQNSFSLLISSKYRNFFVLILFSAPLLFFSFIRIESCSASNLSQLTTTGKSESATTDKSKSITTNKSESETTDKSEYITTNQSESATKDKSKSTIIIDADMQYSYALELFNHNDFNTAIVEFSRFIHFFSDDNRITDAIFKKGVCLFNTKQYKEAVKVFRDLSVPLFENYINDNIENSYRLRVDSLFMLSSTFAAMNQDGSAEMVLQDFLLLNDDPKQDDRTLYSLALLYLTRASNGRIGYKESSNMLEKSLGYLDKMTPDGKSFYKAESLAIDIEKSVQIAKQNKKSPAIAGVASIVPGGGFAYCNRYQDAITAFLLNSAFAFAAVESFEDGSSALGALILFVGSGFYGGSIYGGISSAHKHNKELIKDELDSIRKEEGLKFNINSHYTPPIEQEEQNQNRYKVPLISIKIPF